MPYVAYADLATIIPLPFLTEALDDVGDGSQIQATFEDVAQQASDAIDGYLGLRYSVPIPVDENGNLPAVVVNAARIFTAELLYKRRGVIDANNPWSAQAGQIRTQLKAISLGQSPLGPAFNRKDPSASIITQRMSTVPCMGAVMEMPNPINV